MTNYEQVYSHPELMIPWLPICGNHEYRGNTQAVLDYSKISRRWRIDEKYYTRTYEKKGTSIRLIWLDTTPLIQRYRKDPVIYPDAYKEDADRQLAWLCCPFGQKESADSQLNQLRRKNHLSNQKIICLTKQFPLSLPSCS